MEIKTPGYEYELFQFEASEVTLPIRFIHKEKDENGVFVTVQNGTTNEEVLAMLINRLQFLGQKLPSRETSLAITKLEEALHWLNARTQERKARGVEGTPEK